MFLAVLMLALTVSCGGCDGCSGCNGCDSCEAPPPELYQVYDRMVELIEASKEINTVLYGVGLPVYHQGGDYANYNQLYQADQLNSYEMVTEYAKFISEGQIKDAAEKVYSKECLAPFYTAAFEGLGFSSGGTAAVTEARYYEDTSTGWMYASRDAFNTENQLSGMRVYDYSTIEIIKPSNAKRVRITIDSWMENDPENVQKTSLMFVPGEDGKWYLDTFTG